MTALVPRLRMFAGPNGSGKSTIKDTLPPQWLGVYINADDMEKSIRADGSLNLADFEVVADAGELQAFFAASTLQMNGWPAHKPHKLQPLPSPLARSATRR